MNLASELRCPICRELLAGVEQGLACTAGHHFDQAQEGYVHLLPGGARGKFPGDSPPMLRARRRFLARGCRARVFRARAFFACVFCERVFPRAAIKLL